MASCLVWVSHRRDNGAGVTFNPATERPATSICSGAPDCEHHVRRSGVTERALATHQIPVPPPRGLYPSRIGHAWLWVFGNWWRNERDAGQAYCMIAEAEALLGVEYRPPRGLGKNGCIGLNGSCGENGIV